MVYEILEEMMDFGFPQVMNTEQVKPFVSSTVVQNKQLPKTKKTMFGFFNKDTVVADVTKTGIQQNTNDIYVDVIENIVATFNSSGNIINSYINGQVLCKSYIAGNPSFKMRFCDNIVVGQDQSYGIKLDDVNFHPCVNYSDFEFNKTLNFSPPNGTSTAMTYRISKDFNYPFKIHSFIDEKSNFKIVLSLKVSFITDNRRSQLLTTMM